MNADGADGIKIEKRLVIPVFQGPVSSPFTLMEPKVDFRSGAPFTFRQLEKTLARMEDAGLLIKSPEPVEVEDVRVGWWYWPEWPWNWARSWSFRGRWEWRTKSPAHRLAYWALSRVVINGGLDWRKLHGPEAWMLNINEGGRGFVLAAAFHGMRPAWARVFVSWPKLNRKGMREKMRRREEQLARDIEGWEIDWERIWFSENWHKWEWKWKRPPLVSVSQFPPVRTPGDGGWVFENRERLRAERPKWAREDRNLF